MVATESWKDGKNSSSHKKIRYSESILAEVFTGMQGRYTRLRIIQLLKDEPLNANQVAHELGLDYRTIQHNIRVLETKNMISRVGGKYGSIFFLSPFLEDNLDVLNKLIKKIEKKLESKKTYNSCLIAGQS